MTQAMISAREGTRVSTRQLGLASVVAGILGAASGIGLALVDPAVDESRYSYPLSAGAFIAIQSWFAVQHLGLLAGVVAMRSSGYGASRAGTIGLWLALGGLGLLTATEVLAAFAADFDYSGTYTTTLDASYGISCVAAGVGLIFAGIVYARDRSAGWWRYVPLATGIFVFVPMFPAMMAGFTAARLGITGWMLMFALLGWAVARRRDV